MSDEAPWWYSRCTHREFDLECWRVLREAEQVVMIYAESSTHVHLLVDIAGVGSVCKVLSYAQYQEMSEPEILALVADQVRNLKSVL